MNIDFFSFLEIKKKKKKKKKKKIKNSIYLNFLIIKYVIMILINEIILFNIINNYWITHFYEFILFFLY